METLASRVLAILNEKKGRESIASYMRSIGLDENVYHNAKRGRSPSESTLRTICLNLNLNPSETYYLLTGSAYDSSSVENNKGSEKNLKKNLQSVIDEFNSSIEQVRELILDVLLYTKKANIAIDIEQVNKILHETGYTPDEAVYLACVSPESEKILLEILKGKLNLDDLEIVTRDRHLRSLVEILVIASQQPRELIKSQVLRPSY